MPGKRSVARPSHSRPAQWAVDKRIRQRKGSRPARQCPEDFDIIFVEVGRLECEHWYRARKTTISRWLDERGKERLIRLRAAFVKHQRARGIPPSMSSAAVDRLQAHHAPKPAPVPLEPIDAPSVDPDIARLAADYLRCSRNGGWLVSQATSGDWWVGTTRRSAFDMLEIAKRKGFDPDLHPGIGREVKAA